MKITDAEEQPGQGAAETLNTLQRLLLKLISHEEIIRLNQNLGLRILRETLIEARAGREVVFQEIVKRPWRAKGKSDETMANYFDLQTREACEYVGEAHPENQERRT